MAPRIVSNIETPVYGVALPVVWLNECSCEFHVPLSKYDGVMLCYVDVKWPFFHYLTEH